jgi:hypothetical protein
MVYTVTLNAQDSAGAKSSATGQVIVACDGVFVVNATIGVTGPHNDFMACGRFPVTPDFVEFQPAPPPTWSFLGAFNIFDMQGNTASCTQSGLALICGPAKTMAENPDVFFGGIFEINPPAASGMKMLVTGLNSMMLPIAGDSATLTIP